MTVFRTSPTLGTLAGVLLMLGAFVAAPVPSRGQDSDTAQSQDRNRDAAQGQDRTQDQERTQGQDRTQGRGTLPDPILTGPDPAPVAGEPISPPDALPVAARHNPLELSAPSGAAKLPHYNWDGTRSLVAPARRFANSESDAPAGSDAARTRAKKQAPLPLFIYDYFEPARRIIEARRAAARARYAPGSYSPGVNRLNRGRPNNRNSSQRPSPASGDGMPRQGDLLGNDGTQPPQDETTRRGGMDAQNQYSQSQNPSQYSQEQYPQEQRPQRQGLQEQGPQDQYSQERNPQGTSPTRQNQAGRNQALPPTRRDADAASSSTTSSSLERQDQKRRDLEDGGTFQGEGGQDGSNERNGNGQDGNANGFEGAVDPLTQINSSLTASIPPSYQLAPGDALTVRYWSATHPAHEFRTMVDAQGALTLEQGRRLVVRGLTLAQAEDALRRQLAHLYRNVQVSLTLKELRSISVTVGGQAFSPGTYVVPSVATAFNVLYAAGGPTETGSLRRIEIRRRGRLVGLLDVYKFVTVGAEAGDVPLQPGDLIYIPARVSRVTIEGEVGSPAIFELTPQETLRDGLHFAGGVKPSAAAQHVQISTVRPSLARVLKDVDLQDNKQIAATPLYDGDLVDVFSVRDTLVNSVTVEGAVDQPGDYALAGGMRVADLLNRARGTLAEAYPSRADLYRWNPNNTLSLIPVDLDRALAGDSAANLPLVRWDRLKVYTREEVAWTGRREVTVRGAVQRPGVYYRSGNLHVRDLLLMAGGPTPDAALDRAVLLHQRGNGTYAYEFVRVGAALQGDANQDAAVQDNDILAVYRVGEAQWTPQPIVSIQGAVVAPGDYPHGENMTLSDLFKLAGGLLPGAGKRVTVAHARHPSADAAVTVVAFIPDRGRALDPRDDLRLADGDVVTVQGTGGFKDRVETVTIRGAVNSPGPVILRGDKMRLSDAIREAGGLRPEAYPEGVEFTRTPTLIGTAGQRGLTRIISRLSDMINQSAYQREQAKSDIERIKATSAAAAPAGPLPTPNAAPAAAPVPSAALATQLARRDLVSAPRVLSADDLAPSGNVAVNLARALRRPGGEDDVTLMDGDTVTVPIMPTTVQVVGAVVNSRAVLFHAGEKVDYYVANSGGFTPDAARDRIVIIHTGGGLIPADKAGPLRPGDVIVVPTKVVAAKISDSHSNGLDDIFRSVTSAAVTLRLATVLLGL
jgi:polysaccharide export outer membrane protein